MALSPKPQQAEIAQAPILVGGPVKSSHPDKWCGIQEPEELYVEVDGGTPGPTSTLSGNDCRLFGTNSIKEGEMWHVDPLVGNDSETSYYTNSHC
jgi:hypothetical protein